MKLETHESVPVTELMALGKSVFLCGSLTSGHWFWTYCLKNFWSCDVAEWTIAHFGPGLGREDSPFANLSRTFREPFADFSPKNTVLETIFSMQGWLVWVCANRVPLKISEHGTIRNWNLFISIDKYKQMSTSLYTDISVKVLYRCSIQPQARILWQFCKKPAKHEYYYDNIYVNNNNGVQTFREPFAALSRSFATAAKTYIHMCSKNIHPYYKKHINKQTCI